MNVNHPILRMAAKQVVSWIPDWMDTSKLNNLEDAMAELILGSVNGEDPRKSASNMMTLFPKVSGAVIAMMEEKESIDKLSTLTELLMAIDKNPGELISKLVVNLSEDEYHDADIEN